MRSSLIAIFVLYQSIPTYAFGDHKLLSQLQIRGGDDQSTSDQSLPRAEAAKDKGVASESKAFVEGKSGSDNKDELSKGSSSGTQSSTPTDTNYGRKGITSTLSVTSKLAKDIRHHFGDTKKNVGKIKDASLLNLKIKADKLKEQQFSLRENLNLDLASNAWIKLRGISDKLKERQFSLRETLPLERASNTWIKLRGMSNVGLHSFGQRSNKTFQTLFAEPHGETTIILAVLTICLLGTSIGFRSYLYFVSVGQSVCIGLVSMVSLIAFNVLSKYPIPILTNIQSFLTLLWSIRLTYFLLHREYVNWPERHQQHEDVEQRATTKEKFSVWWICASFYAMMIMPCIYRLKAAFVGSPRAVWGKFGMLGIVLQCFGLSLESIADYQKGAFKIREGNRNLWCNEGLWKYSTHPNYLGEITFWVGTYLGSMACYTNLLQWAVCTIGLVFTILFMKSATYSLDLKQFRKYGLDEDFIEYRHTHCIFGPFHRIRHKELLTL